MATLREWLTEAGFNWRKSNIIYKKYERRILVCTYHFKLPEQIGNKIMNDMLDRKFSDGYGSAQCPSIIAKDEKRIYFPGTYDGMTWLESIELDIMKYMIFDTPYVGQ